MKVWTSNNNNHNEKLKFEASANETKALVSIIVLQYHGMIDNGW